MRCLGWTDCNLTEPRRLKLEMRQELLANRKLAGRMEAAEAAAALLKEEIVETRQAVSWRDEELGKMRNANADMEVW